MPNEKLKSQPSSSSESPHQSIMSRYLRPERFDTEPNTMAADVKWLHWCETFKNFLDEEHTTTDSMRLKILINHLSPAVFSYIRDCPTYFQALSRLENIYIKPKNLILARHLLTTRKQRSGETISDFAQALKLLAHECKFEQVSAQEHEDQSIRGAFIAGINSLKIKERLLENICLSLEQALNQAISLEAAEQNSKLFTNNSDVMLNALENKKENVNTLPKPDLAVITPQQRKRCFFCGGNVHQRIKCPAFRAECQLCFKKGHFASVCRTGPPRANANAMTADDSPSNEANDSLSAISAASPSSLSKATVPITVNDYRADALIDTGSSLSFIDRNLTQTLKLKIKPSTQSITLASLSHVSLVDGICHATIQLDNYQYKQHPLLIVNNLCADVIIGHDLLRNHSSLQFEFGGPREPLKVCNVMAASLPPASLFTNLSQNIRPIAIRSRRHNLEDESFIKSEVSKLLEDGVIEPSVSPWRAQVLVVGGNHHKKRMVIDYSQTINKYTELDAFPLPSIESIVSKVARFNHFSQIDLKSAYHQVPILQKEKIFTAFEANGKLYQFTRIPFGVTNGVAAFQRALNYIIEKEDLKGTFAYLDDVTVCGKDKKEHGGNLTRFMEAVAKYGVTLNKEKCNFDSTSINLLGYTIQNNEIKPDKNRLKPLLELPIPGNPTALKRSLGLFAHYCKWIPNFSEKVKPLLSMDNFPLSEQKIFAFNELKSEIVKASLVAIDENTLFTVETDASENALAATLTQNGQPVAFFSRSLADSERRQSSIEKEAAAIVEALRKWRHYLIGRNFLLITDQQSVSFMFNQKHSSKIKNEKIERWRLELSCFKYDIIYRPGKDNKAADALTRVCAHINFNNLKTIHQNLCHPGVVRMYHWVKSKNLPYSLNEVRQMTADCRICAEIKPRFARIEGQLIKATAPFERLNIDFKGPLPSKTQNKYILSMIDEYSRFPFAFACKDTSSSSVIKCLNEIFYIFGTPSYIHSDRGSSFLSLEITQYLTSLGIASSRTTPYNPQGNGQVERLNGTLWKTVQLSLKTKDLDTSDWEKVLPLALHSIRSLLCTSINATPHEKMFSHPRRSPNGVSLPAWLMTPGPILIKRNVRNSKLEPLVEEGQLLQSNPHYSYVKYPDGREGTVSNRQLAPLNFTSSDYSSDEDELDTYGGSEGIAGGEAGSTQRHSTRVRRPPSRLNDYVTS